MKLSNFIRTNVEPILEIWEQFAKELRPASPMDISVLRDHANGILLTIADDLDCAQTPLQQQEKSKGRGPRSAKQTEAQLHGAARLAEGFSVNEAMSEIRALRASVLRLWADANDAIPDAVNEDMTRFNEAIDQVLSESLERYTADKERHTRLFDALLSSSPDLNYIFDVDCKLIYANTALAALYGISPSAIIGKNLLELGAPNASALLQQVRQTMKTRQTYVGEMSCTLAGEREMTYEYLFIPVLGQDNAVEAIAGTARDITERKANEEKTRRSANYDFLTGLPNRSLFRDRIEQEFKRVERTGLPIALLFIDLDGFKEVNDRLGHDAGDRLLQAVTERICACVRGTDTVARLGGDEFTVILTEVKKIRHIEILAQEILDELARPFSILQNEIHISGSIGITLAPQDATTPEDLIKNADQAMYVAKNSGRNRFSFFTAGMRDSAWARLKVIDALRNALPLHQLAVYYQPIVELSTGRIVKAEALLRWHHPETGLMHPEEFVGLAEETGLIDEIGEWVLNEALARAHEWHARFGTAIQISVNKSAGEFSSKASKKCWDEQRTAFETGRQDIAVEIPEGVLLTGLPGVAEKLDNLRTAGVQLSVDDFGTGYSSLSYLDKFHVDYIKIDPSFVQGMAASRDARKFIETMIVMAHALGPKVIAEGVETLAQKEWLTAAGCDYAQGYLFSAPVSARDFEKLLVMEKHRLRKAE